LTGGILVVCRNCGFIFDYQYLDGRSAGKRYNGPPHISRIIDINKTCPICGAPLTPPDPSDPKSVVVIPTKVFKNMYKILGKREETENGSYRIRPFFLCRKDGDNCYTDFFDKFSRGDDEGFATPINTKHTPFDSGGSENAITA
jgi:rubredoxin